MIRLAGILTGSAIAVAFLLVALGMPELVGPEPAPPAKPVTPATPVVTEPMVDVADEHSPEPEVAESVVIEAVAEVQPEPETVAAAAPEPIEQHWYAFWSPFRSKIAADGFVSQLQQTTGLDYRVVKLKPGVYEVAFAYSNDSDIQDKLTQISSATGLDLSGG